MINVPNLGIFNTTQYTYIKLCIYIYELWWKHRGKADHPVEAISGTIYIYIYIYIYMYTDLYGIKSKGIKIQILRPIFWN